MKIKVGEITFKKGTRLSMQNFYPNRPDVEIELENDTTVDVHKLNNYTSYSVTGNKVGYNALGEDVTNHCPYPWDLIKDNRFVANANFYDIWESVL